MAFTITAQGNTDIWKKPPSHDVFTAPYRVHSTGTVPTFVSATITFHAKYTTRFDQAGILLTFTNGKDRKWIKSGIELFNDAARLSTVCTDNWSDWGISTPAHGSEILSGQRSVTVRIESSGDELGKCLWVYQLDGDDKVPLREITWPYGSAADWKLEVAAAVARPADGGELEATFTQFDVEWKK